MLALVIIISPLIVAIFIYSSLRPSAPDLLQDIIHHACRAFDQNCSKEVFHFSISLPPWLLYNLPDGLWAFSFSFSICLLNKRATQQVKFFYLFVVFSCMIFLELLQYRWIQGTFDFLDIFFITIGFSMAVVISKVYEKSFT